MAGRLHLHLDRRRLALCRSRAGSLFPALAMGLEPVAAPWLDVGWSMKADRDASLVMDALMMAVWRRGKVDALLHHSDQGSQYTSEQFQRLLADNGITCSRSRAGNVWDNSAMESFFSTLKTERTASKVYRTRNEARADVFDYIERFYNPRRRHSKLGYISPMEFEARAMLANPALHAAGNSSVLHLPRHTNRWHRQELWPPARGSEAAIAM